MKIVVLCGGVGGSKLVLGLHHEFPTDEITVVVNTGDDLEILGLYITPDIDTVTYTLAGVASAAQGWGLADDTFQTLAMLEAYGHAPWFRIGDKDFATHIARTDVISSGGSVTEATTFISASLGVRETVLPMCNERVKTRIRTDDGWLAFQEYFVRRGHGDIPREVEYSGMANARVTPEVSRAIREADVIVAGPSNPVVSVLPILSVPGLLEELSQAPSRTIAVSPFVGDRAVTGPADALMKAIGSEPTSEGVAHLYAPWLDALVLHHSDGAMVAGIEELGIQCLTTDTLMPDLDGKRRLARFVVEAGS